MTEDEKRIVSFCQTFVDLSHVMHVWLICAENKGNQWTWCSTIGWLLIWSMRCHRNGIAAAAAGIRL